MVLRLFIPPPSSKRLEAWNDRVDRFKCRMSRNCMLPRQPTDST